MNKDYKKFSIIFFVICYIFIILFVIFIKNDSVLYEEGRNATSLPTLNIKNIKDWTGEIENYLLDNIGYRNKMIDAAIHMKKYFGASYGSESINIVDVENKSNYNDDFAPKSYELNETKNITEGEVLEVSAEYDELDDIKYEVEKVGNSQNKVVVMGEGENIRAVNIVKDLSYVVRTVPYNMNKIVDLVRQHFGDTVKVHYMIVPMPLAYYFPESLKNLWIDQRVIIESVKEKLSDNITFVNIYDKLYEHKDEYIYFRTDSHWTQLGAYYAAEKFCEINKLPFYDLTCYEEKEIKDYCGSFYRYLEDYRFKENPDTLIYYDPKINYTTIKKYYNLDETTNKYKINSDTSESVFKKRNDGDTYAYNVFLGGDSNTTIVKTYNNNSRKLLLVKDSFGNALAPNLLMSFSELHAVDYRYMKENLVTYIKENKITDVLFESQMAMTTHASTQYLTLFLQDMIIK